MAIDRVAVLRNAEKLLRQGKLDAAIAEYVRVVEEQPRDWTTANTLGDLYLRAGRADRAVEQFVRGAEVLKQDGFLPKAAAIYKKILKIRPADDYSMLQSGDIAAKQGLLVAARQYWNAVAELRQARGDAKGVAEIKIRLGNLDVADLEARTGAARTRVETGDRKGGVADLVAVALEMIDQDRRADGLAVLCEVLLIDPDNQKARLQLWEAYATPAEAEAANGDWAAAAATLQEFITRVPNHVQALARLVEICVDGGLDASITEAQTQLADAYLATGEPGQALLIAEDLMLREPSAPAPVEQLRRALVALGEPDPESVIAQRLRLTIEDAEEPDYVVPELLAPQSPPPPPAAAVEQRPAPRIVPFTTPNTAERLVAHARAHAPQSAPTPEPIVAMTPPTSPRPAPPTATADSAVTAGLAQKAPAVAKPFGKAPEKPAQPAKPDAVEIDLSDLLTDFKVGEAPTAPVFSGEAPPPVPDLDEVFELFREEAEQALGGKSDYERGVQLRDAGRLDESIRAFEAASRVPRYRFDAAAALGRIHRDRGAPHLALEWLERATHAPAADPSEAHELFYELADLLESIGEVERALAICLELQADAGDYRDLSARIQRLTKFQARG